jgi:predicted metal-dependent phosphoesterase TrpH
VTNQSSALRRPVPLSHLTNADLHCHSTVSDGTLEPEAIAARAAANGVQLWALTDHDEIGGQCRARAAAHAHGMAYLTGTEVSVTFAGETVHIVGLGFDDASEELVQGLARTRGGREERAREMAAGLAQVGIKDAFDGALQYVGNPELISRTHFARFLVEHGHCSDTSEVFRRYLTDGKPGFVPHRWAGLGEAVGWITRAVQRIQGPRRPRRRSGDGQPQRRRGTAVRRGGARVRSAGLAWQRFPRPRRKPHRPRRPARPAGHADARVGGAGRARELAGVSAPGFADALMTCGARRRGGR